MPGEIRSISIAGPAGNLEALLNAGKENASYAALVCHPHPLYGGTMHNKVVFHAMKALNGFGFPVLRFNFRGAGLSESEHDQGRGEQEDVRAALEWLEREFDRPVIFAGFSFGAATGLPVACADLKVQALLSIGTPVRVEGREYNYDFLSSCKKAKLFVSGARDQYGPRAELERLFALASEPKQMVLIEGADHFFAGRLAELRHAIENWVRQLL